MATIRHHLTGVELNPIEIERVALDFNEAVTAFILRQQGEKYHMIAQRLGTNTHRLGEVFRGEVHSGAAQRALEILTR